MVEFKLTKEQLLAKELFRSFAENEIKPISRDMDEAEKFDMDLLDKMKKYGLPVQESQFPYILLFAVLVLTTMHQKNRNRNSYVH